MEDKPEAKDLENREAVLFEEEKSTAHSTFDTEQESPKVSNEVCNPERND